EKTSSSGGSKLHEKWSKSGQHGSVQMVVGNRFMVDVDAQGIEMNDVKSLISKIDISKLEAMKGDGKKS
ncbi:MAG: hypothetical protein ABIZ64_15200, partial [Casimicrobium sp.]